MRREGVSVKYIARSSGLQPMPLEMVKPRSIAVARNPGSRRSSRPTAPAEPAIRGARPEAAGAVRLAVVEALIAERQSGNVEPVQLGSRPVESREATAEGEQESAVFSQRKPDPALG